MQPSPAVGTSTQGSNVQATPAPEATTTKRRARRKAADKQVKPVEATKVEPARPDTKGEATASTTTRSPGPYRGKCRYQSRKCENERAVKRNGKPHNLCEEHRSKQNQHQRKFDAKKFSRKRPRGSATNEDAKSDEAGNTEDEPSAKRHRTMTNLKPEPRQVTANQQPMPAAARETYPSVYTAVGSAPMRLPPIQSPRGPILPSSPAIVYAHAGSMRPRVVPVQDAYPRSHVVYSEYRPGTQLQSPHGSHQSYLQQDQRVVQAPSGYSHSELMAASILVQPQSTPSPAAASTPVYYKREDPSFPRDQRVQTSTTPRLLPSLLVPPLLSSPYHQVNGIVPSPAQRFAPVVVTPAATGGLMFPARSVRTVLPPLVPFALRRTPTSTPSVSKQEQ